MVSTLIKSDKFLNNLASAVADLYDKPRRNCDLQVRVGANNFKCHKLILALQSPYFEQLLFPSVASLTTVENIGLNDVDPDDFQKLLSYMYKGELSLNIGNVGRILRLAILTQIEDLQQICRQFMKSTLNAMTCVEYWTLAQSVGDTELENSCLKLFLKDFVRVTKVGRLQDISQEMMKAAIDGDDLDVNSECELCDIVLKWIDANSLEQQQSIRPLQLLSCIRWSGVNIEYIDIDQQRLHYAKSRMLRILI